MARDGHHRRKPGLLLVVQLHHAILLFVAVRVTNIFCVLWLLARSRTWFDDTILCHGSSSLHLLPCSVFARCSRLFLSARKHMRSSARINFWIRVVLVPFPGILAPAKIKVLHCSSDLNSFSTET
jgi:hypothetical protein